MLKRVDLCVFSEYDLFINQFDILLKVRHLRCSLSYIQLYLFFDKIVDFNLILFQRLYAFIYFIYFINRIPRIWLCKSTTESVKRILGLNCLIFDKYIWNLLWNFYLFYFKTRGIRRKEHCIFNCFVFNVYNLFLFPGFLDFFDDLDILRFCSLKSVLLFSCGNLYMRLYLSSFNIKLT